MKNDAMQRRAGGVEFSSIIFCVTVLVAGLPTGGRAQVNTGSNGSDGALNPATSTVINMADHPNGVYQYTSVNIRTNVTVTFIPNANNSPVTWLVQSSVVINGQVNVSAQNVTGSQGGLGGPGGYRGGDGKNGNSPATSGQGPGGAEPNQHAYYNYGNVFLVPLLGGSGGGGESDSNPSQWGGGGGGGAILIAASTSVTVNGGIHTDGSCGGYCGSGGAIRLVASQISGRGQLTANAGNYGRIRFDTYDNEFSGNIQAQFSSGFQPIIIPTTGQGTQLTVTSVGGVAVSASPTGALSTPDAVLSAQQNNPIPIVVQCSNLPVNTPITVSVTPMNGSPVSAVGYNNTGTQASSTATVSLNMPRGGGLIYATAATSH
jgi:hypothetical protein